MATNPVMTQAELDDVALIELRNIRTALWNVDVKGVLRRAGIQKADAAISHIINDIVTQPTTAAAIADAIDINSNKYHMTEIDRATWDTEQNRLWAIAASLGCASEVMHLITPSLRGAK